MKYVEINEAIKASGLRIVIVKAVIVVINIATFGLFDAGAAGSLAVWETLPANGAFIEPAAQGLISIF